MNLDTATGKSILFKAQETEEEINQALPLNSTEADALGLIIVRMDPFEGQQTTGAYSIQWRAE